jgi:hypothetical protein
MFVPGPTTQGVEVITKLDVAHPATVGFYASGFIIEITA